MVDRNDAQFYTMEGIAAAVLMVLTAYLVLGGTTMYTPGDTHIIDMQLEQVGNDALKTMDTKDNESDMFSELEIYIRNMTDDSSNGAQAQFKNSFLTYIDTSTANPDTINFEADIFYVMGNGTIGRYPFAHSERTFSGNENAVRVTRWVFVDKDAPRVPLPSSGFRQNNNQTVLLEVMLWRG